MRRITSALLLAAALAGCNLMTGSGTDDGGRTITRPGTIAFYDHPEVIVVPDNVTAGVPFEVAVVTYGGGCVSAGETRGEANGLVARVSVFDEEFVPGPEGGCTDELRRMEHRATLVLPRAGKARLEVRGWREPGREPLTAERAVVVRPAP